MLAPRLGSKQGAPCANALAPIASIAIKAWGTFMCFSFLQRNGDVLRPGESRTGRGCYFDPGTSTAATGLVLGAVRDPRGTGRARARPRGDQWTAGRNCALLPCRRLHLFAPAEDSRILVPSRHRPRCIDPWRGSRTQVAAATQMVCMQGRWIAGLLLSTAWSPAQAPPGGAVPKPGIGRWLLHEPPAGDAPKLTLRCVYPADQHTLADQSAYLSDLQRRFGELGLRVVVLLQGEVQKATAVDPAASYSLGTITGEAPAGARAIGPVALQQLLQQRDQWDAFGPAQLLTPANELLFAGLPSAGLAGAIRRGLAGKLDADAEFRNARIRADLLSGSMSNGGDFHVPIDALLAHEPTDGI